MADNFNLTGIWEARSSSNGEPYTSEMELVHHGDRVMGKEVGGRTEYFLEGNVVGTSVTLYYFGMYGEKYTGKYELEIKGDGERLDGHYVDDSNPAKIRWEAIKEKR